MNLWEGERFKPMHVSAAANVMEQEADEDLRGSNQGEGVDFCSREGAQIIKARIEAYWRDRGQHVMVMFENVGFHPAIRAARYDVRSDMMNGRPRPPRAGAQADRNEEH